MVKPKIISGKEEPPDRGKASTKQNTRSLPNSPLRSARSTLSKTSAPNPLAKERYEKYTVQAYMKSPKAPTKNTAFPKLLHAVKSVKGVSKGISKAQLISTQPDPLEDSLFLVKNARNIKSKPARNNPRIRKNSEDTMMDYEETPLSNLKISAVTNADEPQAGAKSIQDSVNKHSSDETAAEVFPTNKGNEAILLREGSIDNANPQISTAEPILNDLEPSTLATNKEITVVNEASPNLPVSTEILSLGPSNEPIKDDYNVNLADAVISNQIEDNISKIRAEVSILQDELAASGGSAEPTCALSKSAGNQAGNYLSFISNSEAVLPKLPASISTLPNNPENELPIGKESKNGKLTQAIKAAELKSAIALEIGKVFTITTGEGHSTHSENAEKDLVKTTTGVTPSENIKASENNSAVLCDNENMKRSDKNIVLSENENKKINDKKVVLSVLENKKENKNVVISELENNKVNVVLSVLENKKENDKNVLKNVHENKNENIKENDKKAVVLSKPNQVVEPSSDFYDDKPENAAREDPELFRINFGSTELEVEVHTTEEESAASSLASSKQIPKGDLELNPPSAPIGSAEVANAGAVNSIVLEAKPADSHFGARPRIVNRVDESITVEESISDSEMETEETEKVEGEAVQTRKEVEAQSESERAEEEDAVDGNDDESRRDIEMDTSTIAEDNDHRGSRGRDGAGAAASAPTQVPQGTAEEEDHIVLVKFKDEDKHILKCPMLHNELENSDFKNLDIKDMKVNYDRGLLKLIMGSQQDVQRAVVIRKLKSMEVECRGLRSSTGKYGVIGTIPCPTLKETMQRKIDFYKESLRTRGTPVKSIEWIKKKTWKRGVRGYTTQTTAYLKLEFINEIPEEVYIGRMRYTVQPFTAEPVQCFKCQKFGHIAADCKSRDKVCVNCGTAGHSRRDNACSTRPKMCANCKGHHPSNYRGCIEFKREKEAQKIRSKENKTLHVARRLAEAKIVPPVVGIPTVPAPILPTARNTGSYAAAASSQQPQSSMPQAAPTNTPKSQPTTVPTASSSQHTPQVNTQPTSNPGGPCTHPAMDFTKMEKNLEKMVQKVILKLFSGLARTMLNLVNLSKGGSEEKTLMGIVEAGLKAVMNETVQQEEGESDNDSDSNDREEVVSMQMVNQHQVPETIEAANQREPGAATLQPNSKKLPRLASSHVRIPPKAKKRRKRKY